MLSRVSKISMSSKTKNFNVDVDVKLKKFDVLVVSKASAVGRLNKPTEPVPDS